MLKKEEVFVRVSSEKKARKLSELLDMFNEPTGSQTFELVKNGGDVYYNDFGSVWVAKIDRTIDDKTKVSIKELRNILAKEKLSQAKENTWYKLDDNVYQFNEKNGVGYGLVKDEWVDGMAWLQNENHHDYVEANQQEVEEALIKEAKRRGFFNGTLCNNSNVHDVDLKNNRLSFENNFEFDLEYNTLRAILDSETTYSVFKNGKWAEVIKPEKSLEERVKELEDAVFECSCLKSYIDGDKVILVLEKTKLI